MRIAPLLAVAAVLNPLAMAQTTPPAPCPDSETLELEVSDHNPTVMAKLWRSPLGNQARHRQLAQRAGGYANLATRGNFCLDVTNGNFQNGQAPQLWACSTGSYNQQWQVNGNNLQAQQNKCIDVPSGNVYNGASLQLWDCDQSNQNQWFEVAGNSIRKKNSNFCIDLKDGHYGDGAKLQIWACDWNAQGNQIFTFGGAPTTTTTTPSSFCGYATISWSQFSNLHPECAPYGQAFQDAAAANGLVPTLLGAIAENESSCNPTPGNGFGMMQFMDDNAWRVYGDNGNKQVASDAIWAAARYMRALLNQENQNLDQALRDWNGPISYGGDPNYQQNIRTWMSGGSVW